MDTTDNTLSQVGDLLEQHRNRAGLTKGDVAKRMATSRSQYDRVTRDPRPKVAQLVKAARAVGMTDTAPVLRAAGYDPELVAATRAEENQATTQPVMRLAG